METQRLKIKIGDNEFEAEGPVEMVQAQFDEFKELIKLTASIPPKTNEAAPATKNQVETLSHTPLEKVMKVEDRIVSLTAKCDSIDDAVLLILLGQKESRNNQEVTGAEIMDGLEVSGYKLPRVDRIMDKLSNDGSVIVVGLHRARRYRLSNTGLSKALMVAKEVIATVP
jgi:hypothetical protein